MASLCVQTTIRRHSIVAEPAKVVESRRMVGGRRGFADLDDDEPIEETEEPDDAA